ncbi:MAG: hypothetical protein ACI8ZM_004261 [Crocinitomix sp.]|jgi:hypothetical protein
MKLRLFYLFLFVYITGFGQGNVEQISNKKKSEKAIDLFLGSDILTGLGGSPNLYGEFHFYDKVGIQLGVGYMRTGYLADFANFVNLSSVKKVVRNVSSGLHYSMGLRYIKKTSTDFFKLHFYFDYKKWSYSIKDFAQTRYFRHKGCIGSGMMLQLDNNLGFDAHYGLSVGRDWHEEEHQVKLDNEFLFGYDFGVSMYYAF